MSARVPAVSVSPRTSSRRRGRAGRGTAGRRQHPAAAPGALAGHGMSCTPTSTPSGRRPSRSRTAATSTTPRRSPAEPEPAGARRSAGTVRTARRPAVAYRLFVVLMPLIMVGCAVAATRELATGGAGAAVVLALLASSPLHGTLLLGQIYGLLLLGVGGLGRRTPRPPPARRRALRRDGRAQAVAGAVAAAPAGAAPLARFRAGVSAVRPRRSPCSPRPAARRDRTGCGSSSASRSRPPRTTRRCPAWRSAGGCRRRSGPSSAACSTWAR